MAGFYVNGETKVRPGAYVRYENYGSGATVGADDGHCACVIRSNWGPVGASVLLESSADIASYFGSGDEGSSLDLPLQQFYGGAKTVRAVRVGCGGTAGSCVLLDEAGTEVLSVVLKYAGTRALSLSLRPVLGEETLWEMLVLEGTSELERVTFDNVTGEKSVWGLAGCSSAYVEVTSLAVTDSTLATVEQVPLEGGTDPEVTVEAYDLAFAVLEAHRWNVLAVDTEDVSVQMMMQVFLQEMKDSGKFCMGVVGASCSTEFSVRLQRASGFNDYQMVYVGSGFVDMAGTEYSGYLAAGRVSGMIAGISSAGSITHVAVSGATDLVEYLSNAQLEQAISAGMLCFSLSPSNTVWVESGVNTLVNLGENEDEGWKKIKRTKVRFELMQRLSDTVDALVGRVSNNNDGRMTVIQSCNNICNTMVAEGKLMSGAYVAVDPERSPGGDSAWFVVYADDVDALEKLYYNFKFRFAVED